MAVWIPPPLVLPPSVHMHVDLYTTSILASSPPCSSNWSLSSRKLEPHIEREIFTLKIIRVKSLCVVQFSWSHSIREIF